MKKLLLLLLVMALGAGVVFAVSDPIHPPGVYLEASLSENCMDGYVVTSDAVLAIAMPSPVEQVGLQVVLAQAQYEAAIRPHEGVITEITVNYRTRTSYANYHLLL